MEEKLKFACGCGKVMSAPVQLAGKKGKCPRCGQSLQIPAVASAVADESAVAQPATPESPDLVQPPVAQAPPPPVEIVCLRCGKSVLGNMRVCPFCDARLPSTGTAPEGTENPADPFIPSQLHFDAESGTAISRLLIFYLLLLSTNLLAHWLAKGLFDDGAPINIRQMTIFTLVMEGIDTVIVLVSLAMIPRPPRLWAPTLKHRAVGWLAGGVILACAFGLNLLYHAIIQNYVQFPNWAQDRTSMPLGWSIVLVCVQPGIVEELFFRFIALGTLARVMNIPAAVLVSSVMFGMAHSSVFLSIPILTVVGIGLGCVRDQRQHPVADDFARAAQRCRAVP